MPWPPRIQVAGVSSLEEALFCRSVGVDALGFTLDLPTGIHDGLTRQRAGHIVTSLPRDILPVIITYLTTAQQACDLATEVGGCCVQFHAGLSDDELIRFRNLCPGLYTIGRVTVSGTEAVERAKRLQPPLWDAIILDSWDPGTGHIGATGRVHDWSVSARIVKAATLPVILAGGLNAENVAQSIRAVRPYGVDAHTGLEERNGARSFEKIRAFAQAARNAFFELGEVSHQPACLT